MNGVVKLALIGIGAGTVLAAVLILMYLLTGNTAFYLLFNVDYIPLLKNLQPRIVVEIMFHYVFCMASVVILYYLLRFVQLENRVIIYMIVYTGGSAILFYLTTFFSHKPFSTDVLAWIYWTVGHAIYSVIVGLSIKRWL